MASKSHNHGRPASCICQIALRVSRHHGIRKDPQAQTKNKTFKHCRWFHNAMASKSQNQNLDSSCEQLLHYPFIMPWCLNHRITGKPPSFSVAFVKLHIRFLDIMELSNTHKVKLKIKKLWRVVVGPRHAVLRQVDGVGTRYSYF